MQLAVGLGALHDGWLAFEADEGRKVRAEKLDEGLAVYDGLMRGQPYLVLRQALSGHTDRFPAPPPKPVQQPRVPVWVVGAYPSVKSLGRAARWDGLLPTKVGRGVETPFTPEDLADVVAAIRPLREAAGLDWDGFDVVAEGVSEPGSAADAKVREWMDAGATWWVESDWSMGEDAAQVHRGASTPGHLGRRATGSPHATLSSLQAVLTPGCPHSEAVLTPGCPHSRLSSLQATSTDHVWLRMSSPALIEPAKRGDRTRPSVQGFVPNGNIRTSKSPSTEIPTRESFVSVRAVVGHIEVRARVHIVCCPTTVLAAATCSSASSIT